MSADAGDLLQLAAASAIAAGGAALAFAALAVTFSLRRTCAALGRETPAGAFRSPPLVVLAAANARWLPSDPLSLLDAYIAKAGSPAGLRAPELVAVTELTSLSSLVAGLALRTAIGGAVTILLTLAGAALPLLWVHDKVRARQREMVRALPYAADLLTLSVEAGLDFTAALARVADKGRRGALRDELSVAIKELRLGKTREEALRGLAHRVSLPALTSFVQALLHADRM